MIAVDAGRPVKATRDSVELAKRLSVSSTGLMNK